MKASDSKGNSRVSITRIAEICQVSKMTVSRALRGSGLVSDTTKKHVQDIAKKLGYRLNVRAGRPRSKSVVERNSIDVVVGTAIAPNSLFYMQLLLAIEQGLALRSYDCVIRSNDGSYSGFLSLCESLQLSDSAGTMAIGYFSIEQVETLLDIVPGTIFLDYTGDSMLQRPYESIGFDNVEAARIATRHLLAIGRKRILLIRGQKKHCFSRDMELGYLEVVRDNSLPHDESLILETNFTGEGANQAVTDTVQAGIDFDAVFTNDEMAVGVIRALYDVGRSVPEDVAVVGCDGLPLGLYLIPKLTTVVMDYRKLGEIAVERVVGERPTGGVGCHVRIVPSLEVRESTTAADNSDE